MLKNTATTWVVFAFGGPDHATLAGKPITGGAANITANIRIDGGAADAVDDTNPTELEGGYYLFNILAAETNGDNLLLAPASSTANVQVVGVPGAVWTETPLDAAGVRSAVGLAAADLDTQLDALPTATEIRVEVDANSAGLLAIANAIAALNDPTAAAIATSVWATVCESQGNYTAKQIMSVMLAVLAGVTSNGGATFETPDGVANRLAATVDASNNRTAMTITPSA